MRCRSFFSPTTALHFRVELDRATSGPAESGQSSFVSLCEWYEAVPQKTVDAIVVLVLCLVLIANLSEQHRRWRAR